MNEKPVLKKHLDMCAAANSSFFQTLEILRSRYCLPAWFISINIIQPTIISTTETHVSGCIFSFNSRLCVRKSSCILNSSLLYIFES